MQELWMQHIVFPSLWQKCSHVFSIRIIDSETKSSGRVFCWSCRQRKRNNPFMEAFNRIQRHVAFCSMFYIIGRESIHVTAKGCSWLSVFWATEILRADIQSPHITRVCFLGFKTYLIPSFSLPEQAHSDNEEIQSQKLWAV